MNGFDLLPKIPLEALQPPKVDPSKLLAASKFFFPAAEPTPPTPQIVVRPVVVEQPAEREVVQPTVTTLEIPEWIPYAVFAALGVAFVLGLGMLVTR